MPRLKHMMMKKVLTKREKRQVKLPWLPLLPLKTMTTTMAMRKSGSIKKSPKKNAKSRQKVKKSIN